MIALGDAPVSLADIVAAAEPETQADLTASAWARLAAARRVVEQAASGDTPVYGVNTGLGGNLGHRLEPPEIAAFQKQIIRGRMVGVGEPLPAAVSRAAMFCRIAGVAQGGSGMSCCVARRLIDLFNAGVTPLIPARGSIGAGDLALCAHMAAIVIGEGEAWLDGRRLSGAEALREAGLSPLELGPKDGLSLINASSVTVAHGALVLAELGRLIDQSAAIAALAFEGFCGNPTIFDPRLAAARPAAGQEDAAALFRVHLAGSTLHDVPPRRIQDALSFRVLAPIYGVMLAAIRTATEAIETEANAAADNPLVLDEEILSTANFHTPAIALAFDMLAIAVCHIATASAQRTIKLMNAALTGLPKYLTPLGGASNGLNSLQKTVAALHAELRLAATPASLDSLAVSETVEDHAPQTLLTISKLARQLLPFRLLIATEALTAAQAIDLRGRPRLGAGSRQMFDLVRSIVPPLAEDRPPGPDVDRVAAALERHVDSQRL